MVLIDHVYFSGISFTIRTSARGNVVSGVRIRVSIDVSITGEDNEFNPNCQVLYVSVRLVQPPHLFIYS